MLLPIAAGAVLGVCFSLLCRLRGPAGEARTFAIGLVIAALIYVGLAVRAADPGWLGVEAAGTAVFSGLARLGVGASIWLAIGWLLHVAWDVGLHLDQAQPVVGTSYPLLCVGFDLVVAGFILGGAPPRRRSH